MKVQTKALLEVVVAVSGTLALVFSLDYFFPKYGILVYMVGILCYLVYCLYSLRVGALKREQDNIVDTLKQ